MGEQEVNHKLTRNRQIELPSGLGTYDKVVMPKSKMDASHNHSKVFTQATGKNPSG